MAASSVTGVGLGDSNGKQKPELHSGCGCCSGSLKKEVSKKIKKTGCYLNYGSCNLINYKSSSPTIISKSCF